MLYETLNIMIKFKRGQKKERFKMVLLLTRKDKKLERKLEYKALYLFFLLTTIKYNNTK